MRRTKSIVRAAVAELVEQRVLLSVAAGTTPGVPPHKFVIPVGGVPQVDWAVTAYTDQDPTLGAAADYRGRQYAYDGSTAVHFALPDFAAMDRGVDVYAAAPGTVVETHDGEYDRHLGFVNPPPAGPPDNYV